jgi:periplasmic protein TonB
VPVAEQASDTALVVVSGDGPDQAPVEDTRSFPAIIGVCGCTVGGVSGSMLAGLTVTPLPPLLMPAPPLPATPLRAGIDAPVPTKTVDVAPRYPQIARDARLEGVVVLDATIDERGGVVDVRVLRSNAALDRAAIDAVRQWRYAPATRNGIPVRVLLTVTTAFSLPR